MKKHFLFPVAVLLAVSCGTPKQTATSSAAKADEPKTEAKVPEPKLYRAAYTITNELVHTKLELKPVWAKMRMDGKASITLHPHFYPTDSLILNAHGMDIHEVSMLTEASVLGAATHQKLNYTYDSLLLHIYLGREYKRDENYTVFIDYTSKPEELADASGAFLTDKGLNFVNADGKDPEKPVQFWTEGEPNSNSTWFPTIENPAQKMTQEIYLTVDSHFVTLSNGLLISSTKNADGTRTDYWKQSLPASPYLTMVTASDYAVVKDRWRNIEVNYYLNKDYEKYARMIFGNTPEMLEHFSKLLGVDYPWEKFSQVIATDHMMGSMENTSAVVHGAFLEEDSAEYMDDNSENIIAHEFFHQWFGDLVTCESWSNLPLNESFADYGEYLWDEYKYGLDQADMGHQRSMSGYTRGADRRDPDLIRFNYEDIEDMMGAVTYNKGGCILHMLRKYVGDDAFFASLKLYLETKKFQSAEAHDLRLAFEKVTGEDLNWFFNQWFFNHGYPKLDISYDWSDSLKKETVTIVQKQDFENNPLYKLPMAVDIYHDGKVERKKITVEKVKETFSWNFSSKPDLVNVDAEKMLLGSKTDSKTKENLAFEFYNAPLYMDRYEPINKAGTDYEANSAQGKMMADALNDKFWNIRSQALKNIGPQLKANKETMKAKIISIAMTDEKPQVRVQALKVLSKYYKDDSDAKQIAENSMQNEKSNLVRNAAFKAICESDKAKGTALAKQMESSTNGDILSAIATFYKEEANPESNSFFVAAIKKTKGFNRYGIVETYGRYLKKQNGKVLEDGITQLIGLGKNSASGFVRYAAVNGLIGIGDELKSQMDKSSDKEEELRKNKAAEKEIQDAGLETTRLKKQFDDLLATVKDIKSNEKDKRVKDMFNSN